MKNQQSRYSLLKEATILVVEDDESESEELGDLFDIYFKKCFRAKNGKDGLEKFTKYHPDMVLSDFSMPVMNGFEMIKEIRKLDKKASILLLTIYGDNDIFLKAIEYKISGYLSKPTNATLVLDTLLKEYENLLKDKHLENEKRLKQAILEEFPDKIMVLDLNNNVLFANNVVKQSKHWKNSKTLKCYEVLYGFQTPCSMLGFKCDSEKALETCEVQESFHEKRCGGLFQVFENIKTIPIKNIDGNLYAVLKIVQDRTSDANRQMMLENRANYDILTKLPSRILFYDRLKRAILRSKRIGIGFVLLFIDLDGFKDVNDRFGHSTGDKLLKLVSHRMKASIRKIDTVARYGGDEFVIILEEIDDMENVVFIIENILIKLNEKFELDEGIKINISCSIGVDIYDPKRDNKTDDEMIQNADSAMYRVKHSGKNDYRFFRFERES